MPTALALSWQELQSEPQYEHAKGLLEQLNLI
jgi:beta-N-acetylhexosaminidase